MFLPIVCMLTKVKKPLVARWYNRCYTLLAHGQGMLFYVGQGPLNHMQKKPNGIQKMGSENGL